MFYSALYKCDVVNGRGFHVSLFLSGCTHHCDGCFNPCTWNFRYGRVFNNDTIDEVLEALQPEYITSLCLLGGDPLDNAEEETLARLLQSVRHKYGDSKEIWLWTGYTYEQVIKDFKKLNILKYCDVLIDGEFEKELKDLNLPYRGSSNQKVVDVKKSLSQGEVVLLAD